MRLLAVLLFAALSAAPAPAAETDADKAKAAAAAFLKALRAKDVDAVMKTVDVPFYFGGVTAPVEKRDAVRARFAELVKDIDPKRLPTTAGPALAIPDFQKTAAGKSAAPFVKAADTIAGKTGYAVQMLRDDQPRGYVLVRIKGGKAAVVWMPK